MTKADSAPKAIPGDRFGLGIAVALAVPALISLGSLIATGDGSRGEDSFLLGLMFVGLISATQFIYILPLAIFAGTTRRYALTKGFLAGAGLVFLLQVTCVAGVALFN